MTKPEPKPKLCDKCGKNPPAKGEIFCRRCYARMFGHEPEQKGPKQ